MAKAELTKEIIEVVQEAGVLLTLDKDEAQFLLDLLEGVGGSHSRPRRRYQASISVALESVVCFKTTSDYEGSIVSEKD